MKKKNLIVLLLIALIGIVGVTIAYFSSTTTFENEFQTKEYGTTYTESFVSPDNWLPGDTTNKTVIVTNSGQVDEAVRISLSETWIPNNSNATLNGWIHADGTKSNHTTENELSTDVRAAIINFTNNSDWTKVGDYYYYNYRLAPGQTTDSIIESVTFNALTKLGDTCITSSENGIKTITCNSSGEDYDHATYKLTVNIETVQYNKYQEVWNTNVNISSMKPMNATQLALKSNPVTVTNYTDGDIHQMYTFNHQRTDQTLAQTEYRYIGDDPYNYVYFNCDSLDNQNSSTCEVWRIIGVFDVEREIDDEENPGQKKTITETRMKLVRGSDFASSIAWNSNSGYENDWSNASLKIYLNGTYLESLSATAQSQIEDAIYYLGGRTRNNTTHFGSTEDIYIWERGTETCVTTGNCSGGTRPTRWEGKVALMYPSDMYMTYANGVDSTCYNDPSQCTTWRSPAGDPTTGWIHNTNKLEGSTNQHFTWFVSPGSSDSYVVFDADPDGFLVGDNQVIATIGARPVVYLKSDIKIDGGTGESTNPYKLGL